VLKNNKRYCILPSKYYFTLAQKINMRVILFSITAFFIISCNNNNNNNVSNTEPYTKERSTVNPNPVKEYVEDVGDQLNPEWKFKVQLFEQKESLKYEAKFQYKEVTGEKIFSFPNLGFMPKPELKVGPDKFSCIIGFYDADSVFMELRLIKVENENLVYRHLKEYSVGEEKK
jgi:hypothetical protein